MIIKVSNKEYFFRDDCPDEVIRYYKDKIKKIPKDVYYKYLEYWPRSKKIIFGECDISRLYTETILINLIDRKYFQNKLIHPSVIMKSTCSSKEWRDKNSKAQFIAQNKLGQREINSQALKKAWQSDKADNWRNSIVKHSKSQEKRDKISKASKKLWQNKEYRKMMLDKFKGFQGVSGVFYSKYSGNLRFESTYELYYAFIQDLKGNKLERFKGEIRYFLDNVKRGYRPDFIYNNKIIEIKSNWIMKNYQATKEIKVKEEAAIKYIKENNLDDFNILTENELTEIGTFDIKNQIIYLLEMNKHILIQHGKITEFKRRTDKYIQAEEIINTWNLLK